MTQTQDDDRYQELRQKLQEAEDAALVRALAIMDVADELHRQSNQRIDSIAESLEESSRQFNERMSRLEESQRQTDERINQVVQLMAQSIERANIDRAIVQQNQVEIRRIWEYLLSQRPNGHGQ